MGYRIPAKDVHKAIIKYFQLSQDRKLRGVANKLGKLRANRIHADYDTMPPVTPKLVEISLQWAESIMADLNEMSTST